VRTIVYVDAFNIYFRMLDKNPALKWLDLKKLCRRLLRPVNQIVGIKYYTARVSGRLDADGPRRQQLYLDALATIPELSMYWGTFLITEKFAGLVKPPNFRPKTNLAQPWPAVVKVIKVEEKGTDVNLASHLLLDAFQDAYDVAVVLSNDTDLIEPIRIVTQVLCKPIGLLSPVTNPNPKLCNVSKFIRRISVSDLAACQFDNPIVLPNGRLIHKPPQWV